MPRIRILKTGLPLGQIEFVMGNTHVATPNEQIRADILERTKDWPDHNARLAAAEYAIYEMDKNRRLCRDFRL